MESPRTLLATTAMTALFAVFLFACPAGTKVSADFDVRVDPKTCREDPSHAAALNAKGALAGDLVDVLCSVDGGVSVHVQFPRRAWHDLLVETEDGGAKSFPGK